MYKLKALVCGMEKGAEAQIHKKIQRLGFEVIGASGDAGKKFDRDCDVCILLLFWMSHARFDEVKNAYKNRGIPILSMRNGFSEIKEDLEKWVAENKPKAKEEEPVKQIIYRPKDTAMKKAFEAAKVEPRVLAGRVVNDEETVARIHKCIRECDDSGMNIRDTMEMLEAEGLRKVNGEPFDYGYVHSTREQLRRKKPKPAVVEAPAIQQAPEATMIVEQKPNATGAVRPTKYMKQNLTLSEKMDLIGKVMASTLPADRKLILVDQIQKGEINGEDAATARKVRQGGVECLQVVRTSIFAEHDSTIITVNKIQAIGLLNVIDKLKEFVNE